MSSELTPLYEDHLPGGGLWSTILRRHQVLRLTDLEGTANVSFMAWNAVQPVDRMNLPDTLKAQYTARLTRGHVLMSDMGRALLSITADTVGWHDPVGGYGNATDLEQKYGSRPYQEARNDWYRNARDNFLIEAGKHGLGARDLMACVNFFSRLDAGEDGFLTFATGHSSPGASVDLRAQMDVLVALTACPHPLDPAPTYSPGPVLLSVFRGSAPATDDYCRCLREENARSFTLAERFHA